MTTSSVKKLAEPLEWELALDEICPACDRRKGSHTLDEYVECIRKRVEKMKEFLH